MDSGEIDIKDAYAKALDDLRTHLPTVDDPGWCPVCEQDWECARYATARMFTERRHSNG